MGVRVGSSVQLESCPTRSALPLRQCEDAATMKWTSAVVYENLLVDPELRQRLGRCYGAIDLSTSTQMFVREITPELIQALSSAG